MRKHPFQRLAEQLIPCLVFGIAIALLIGVFVLLSYVLVWGLIIGSFLWIFVKIKALFKTHAYSIKKQPEGRIIEHDRR
jgi:hypothetical protein